MASSPTATRNNNGHPGLIEHFLYFHTWMFLFNSHLSRLIRIKFFLAFIAMALLTATAYGVAQFPSQRSTQPPEVKGYPRIYIEAFIVVSAFLLALHLSLIYLIGYSKLDFERYCGFDTGCKLVSILLVYSLMYGLILAGLVVWLVFIGTAKCSDTKCQQVDVYLEDPEVCGEDGCNHPDRPWTEENCLKDTNLPATLAYQEGHFVAENKTCILIRHHYGTIYMGLAPLIPYFAHCLVIQPLTIFILFLLPCCRKPNFARG